MCECKKLMAEKISETPDIRSFRETIGTLPKQKEVYYGETLQRFCENSNNIYAAMDKDDLAQVVRASTNEVKKLTTNTDKQPLKMFTPKSVEASAKYRIEGNDHYKAGRNRQAIELYNKAIAFAPLDSVELELALGNRSAVFYAIKYYTGCVIDIRDVSKLVVNKKKILDDKLKKRLELAMQYSIHERAIDYVTNVPFTTTFLDGGYEKNAEVPCVSTQVEFTNDKKIKAKTAIMPGSLVGVEKAYAVCMDNTMYLSCHYCSKVELCLIPCQGCTQVLFCSMNCMNLCYNEYHRIECFVMIQDGAAAHNEKNYPLMRKTAIKLSLKLGWYAFVMESKKIGWSRMKNSSVKETYNSDIATSILCYDDTEKHFIEGRLLKGSVVCSELLTQLEACPGYFPDDEIKKADAWDAMARVMLYLNATYNTITYECSAFVFDLKGYSGEFKRNVQTNHGWFSMCSKLKHSCAPNVQIVGLNDYIALVALRTIKKGEELTICYTGQYYYESTIPKTLSANERRVHVFLRSGQFCDCIVCRNNWHSTSPVHIKMTKKQAKVFNKVNVYTRNMTFSSYHELSKALDIFPINSTQHQYVYKNFMEMLLSVQCKYTQNKTYFN